MKIVGEVSQIERKNVALLALESLHFLFLNSHAFNFKVFGDAACARDVRDLLVKCPSDGCRWTGELRNVEV